MIITLPSENRPVSNPVQGLSWDASHIMYGQSSQYYWHGAMTLSIKWFFHGVGFYNVGAGNYASDEDHYLVLNQGQTYSITVDAHAPVRSLIIFFHRGFAEDVYRSLILPTRDLLDEPIRASNAAIDLIEKLYPHDNILSPALFALRDSLNRREFEPNSLKEQLHELLVRLFQVNHRILDEIERLPPIKFATRTELYRRLFRARDFIYSSLDRQITLEDMAQVACLSPNHFLRNFKTLFHASPHQYLTKLRIEKAKRLLVETTAPVTEICLAVGFESLGSFSQLFRKIVGLSPNQYRVAVKKGDIE